MYVWDPYALAAIGTGAGNGWGFPFGGAGSVENTHRAFEDHNYFEFRGQELTAPLFTHPDAGTTTWFGYRNNGFAPNGSIYQLWSKSLSLTNPIRVLNVKIENDGTLSLYVGGSPDLIFANTGAGTNPFSFQCNTWFYFQFNVRVDFHTIGLNNFLRVQVDVALDGEMIITGAQGTSNFFTDNNFAGLDPSMIFGSWSQPNGSGLTGLAEPYISSHVGDGMVRYPGNLWDIFIDAPGSGYTSPPAIVVTTALGLNLTPNLAVTIDWNPITHVGTGAVITLFPESDQYLGNSFGPTDIPIVLTADPGLGPGSGFLGHATLVPSPFRRVSQAVAEPASLPDDSFVHASQLVVEHAFHPLDSFIHASQLVIELPLKREQSGWVVKEC